MDQSISQLRLTNQLSFIDELKKTLNEFMALKNFVVKDRDGYFEEMQCLSKENPNI